MSIIQIQHLYKTFGTGENAVHALEDITTPEGDLIHCTNCEWTIEEGVLHVLVSYDHHAYIPQEPVLMETLDIEMEG